MWLMRVVAVEAKRKIFQNKSHESEKKEDFSSKFVDNMEFKYNGFLKR